MSLCTTSALSSPPVNIIEFSWAQTSREVGKKVIPSPTLVFTVTPEQLTYEKFVIPISGPLGGTYVTV